MKRRAWIAVALVVGTAGGFVLGAACTAIPSDIGLASGHLRPCPASPNCVNSEDALEASAVEPFAFAGDARRAFEALVAFVESEPRVELVTREETYAHFVFRTPFLRFRDDLELRLDEGASVIHVRSASRIGQSDFGANRERVDDLRSRWVPPTPTER